MKLSFNLKIYFWGKIHFVRGLLARDIANYSYSSNTHLTQAFNLVPRALFPQSQGKAPWGRGCQALNPLSSRR